MEKAGAPRGSGAVESLGKQLQRRLRGGGQIWTAQVSLICFECFESVCSSKTRMVPSSGIENYGQLRDARGPGIPTHSHFSACF
jgi:hypothetical protein